MQRGGRGGRFSHLTTREDVGSRGRVNCARWRINKLGHLYFCCLIVSNSSAPQPVLGNYPHATVPYINLSALISISAESVLEAAALGRQLVRQALGHGDVDLAVSLSGHLECRPLVRVLAAANLSRMQRSSGLAEPVLVHILMHWDCHEVDQHEDECRNFRKLPRVVLRGHVQGAKRQIWH